MLTRYAPYGLRSGAMADTAPDAEARIRARLTCYGDDDDDKPGDDGKFVLAPDALKKRVERAEAAGQRKLLESLGVKDADELKAKLAAPAAKPEVKPDPKPETPAFDAKAFKAELLADVKTEVKGLFTSTLDERAAAEKKARDDADATRAADQAVKDAAKAAGIADDVIPAATAMARALSKDGGKTLDFAALVAAHPTLKGVEEKPADNGSNGERKPKDGKPPAFNAQNAKPADIAARKAQLKAEIAAAR